LERLRDDLSACIGCGCLSLEKCALFNRDDMARKLGSGPRYLLGDTRVQAESAPE
jgi:MerR family redox-sensitive transcriptional activator SoxR